MAEEASNGFPEKEGVTEIAQKLTRSAENCSDTTLRELEKLKLKTEENYAAALDQIAVNMAAWRSLLDEKEAELRQSVEETRARKMAAFAERETLLSGQINLARKLVAESVITETASQELLDQGPSLLTSLSSPLSPHHSHLTAHPGLGFCSNIHDYIVKALSMGMWVSGEDVTVGERVVVSAVGGLQPNGTFWVRCITSNLWKLECALQYISDSLFEVPQSCDPLEECSPGQLCVGRFSQDGRWYRAVVTSLPRSGVAKYFFLDHGGSEEAPISSLYPLPDRFRALPFQMIHVRLTSDLSIDFNTREMRWSFTDTTHNKHLVADILGRSEVDEAGPVYLIHLEDHTQEQAFDVGKVLVTAARAKEPTAKFKSRDIRFPDNMASGEQATPTTTTTSQRETPPNDVVPSSQQNGEDRTDQISSDRPTEAVNDEREVGGASESLAPPSDVHTVPPSPVTHATSPPPSTVSPSQTTPQLQSDSSSPPPLPTPSPLVIGSPNSQRSTSALQTEGGLDSVPNSDTTPNDSGTDMFIPTDDSRDSIPPQDIPDPDSIPHSKDPPTNSDSVVSPHSIPLTKEYQTGTKPGPLQLDEVEGVLRNAGVANDDQDEGGEDEVVEAVESIHPSVEIGMRLEVEVVTELSAEGSFWCQLVLSSEVGASYDRLQETLQVGAGRGDDEAFTPVFYHVGELCTARFSEDGDWYRARIERVCPGAPLMTFTVRYIDFGNSEERQQHELIPLGSKFRLLPPRAIHCSVATTDHVTFTQAEREKFDNVTTQEWMSIEVLAVKEEFHQPGSVRLFQTHTDSEPVDVTELISTAGKPAVKPVPRRQWSSSTDLETQTIGHVVDWASHMEDQQEDSVFLTLPGHESSRETTPLTREATPTNEITSSSQREVTTNQRGDSNSLRRPRETRPTTRREATSRETTPTMRKETTPTIRREVTSRETTPTMRKETTPTIRREATSRETTPTVQREATPTIQQNATSRQQTASPVATVTSSARSVSPQREATPTQWVPLSTRSSNFLRVPPSNRDSRPRQARLDLSRAKHSIMSSLGGAKTVPRPLRHDDSEGSPNLRRTTRHSRQDHANPIGKLYVKCPTEDMSDSKIKELFGRYGDVLELDPHTTDSSVVYVTMDVKGAEEVVANLNGYQTSPGHHLVVEKYRARSPSPPPQPPTAASALADLAGVDHVKLFVKNMSADHSPANLRTVFSRYGRVLKMVPDSKRKNVTYIFMDAEGGAKAVNNLHGKAISKNGKPLIVEPSYDPRNR